MAALWSHSGAAEGTYAITLHTVNDKSIDRGPLAKLQASLITNCNLRTWHCARPSHTLSPPQPPIEPNYFCFQLGGAHLLRIQKLHGTRCCQCCLSMIGASPKTDSGVLYCQQDLQSRQSHYRLRLSMICSYAIRILPPWRRWVVLAYANSEQHEDALKRQTEDVYYRPISESLGLGCSLVGHMIVGLQTALIYESLPPLQWFKPSWYTVGWVPWLAQQLELIKGPWYIQCIPPSMLVRQQNTAMGKFLTVMELYESWCHIVWWWDTAYITTRTSCGMHCSSSWYCGGKKHDKAHCEDYARLKCTVYLEDYF